MVERVLCKHEVVGSIPSGSTIPRDHEEYEIPSSFLRKGRGHDIVNEGPVRLRIKPGLMRAGLKKTLTV